MVELDSAAAEQAQALPAPADVDGDLALMQELQVVDEPKAEGRTLAFSVVAFVLGGVALATVSALGFGAILDVAGILARQ